MSELTVFLNGNYVPYSKALIPVEDRGFMFADGIYEVIACYGGRPFRLHDHLARLRQSAEAIEINLPYDESQFAAIVSKLIAVNNLSDASVYLQVTRGVAPRNHLFPEAAVPTVVGIARPYSYAGPDDEVQGVSAITLPDNRWGICYVKSVGLLPNVLARQAAHREGAAEAILVRDGLITEGTSSNVFCVLDGTVYTHPLANILAGITRMTLLELMTAESIPYREQAVPLHQFRTADEIFITSTRQGVTSVVTLDGQPVGDGQVGPVARRLARAYRLKVREECGRGGLDTKK